MKENIVPSLIKGLINVDPSKIRELIAYANSIGLVIKIVTLTGGPCAGKTDSLIRLEIDFTKRGYQVILLPEAATIVRNQGFRAEQGVYNGDMCQWMMMINNEYSVMMAIITAIASHHVGEERKLLIIRDRCSLDGAAYVSSPEMFEAMLIDSRFSLRDILCSDVSIFLRSLAFDRPDLYMKFSANNTARFENVDQAKEADQRLLNIYEKYSHPHIICNDFSDFEDKIRAVVDTIVDALGEPRLEKEKAFFIYDPKGVFINRIGLINHVDITQFYIGEDRYRRVDYPGGMHSSFIKTTKANTGDKAIRFETECPISASEYIEMLEGHHHTGAYTSLKKRRYFKAVELDNGYFVLEADFFGHFLPDNWVRVEFEYGLCEPDPTKLFEGLRYIDVTGRSDCSNRAIAMRQIPTNLFN